MKRTLCGFFLLDILIISALGQAQQRIDPSPTLVKPELIQPDSCTMDFLTISGYGFGPHVKVKMALTIDSVKKQATYSQSFQFGISGMFMTDSVIVRLPDLTPVYSSSIMPNDVTILHFDQLKIRGSWDVDGKKYEIADSLPSPLFRSNFLLVLVGWLPLIQGKEYSLALYDYMAGKDNNLRNVIVQFTGYSVLKSVKVKLITVKELSGKMAAYIYYFDASSGKLLMMEKEWEGRVYRMVREGYGE